MSIRVGVQLHPQHASYDEIARSAQQVDEGGFDTLWTWDHFFPLYGTDDAPLEREVPGHVRERDLHGAHFEGWTLLTAFACLTKRVEIGMLVTCNGYRNVNLLADMARTVDHVSHGRLILGIGSGWFGRDFDEYGYEFGTAGSRLKDLEESLPVLLDRLERLHPRPLRHPMPLIIGGGGEKLTLRLVARHATMWNFFGTPETIQRKMEILDGWCAEVGRDPSEIERTVLMTEPSLLDHLDAYYDVGIRHFIYGLGAPFDLAVPGRILAWRQDRPGR